MIVVRSAWRAQGLAFAIVTVWIAAAVVMLGVGGGAALCELLMADQGRGQGRQQLLKARRRR